MQVMGQVINDQHWVLWDDVKEAVEAYRTKSESGTTGCLAAGGGIKQCKPDRLAGREPCPIEDFVQWVEEQLADLHGPADLLTSRGRGKREAYSSMLAKAKRVIEARRRNAGCV